MKTVILDHLTQPAAVQTESRLLDVLLSRRVNVVMACGGRGICGRCQVDVFYRSVSQGIAYTSTNKPRLTTVGL